MLAHAVPGGKLMNTFGSDPDASAMGSAADGALDNSHAETVNARRRRELLEMLADPSRVDFDVVDSAWGGSVEESAWSGTSLLPPTD